MGENPELGSIKKRVVGFWKYLRKKNLTPKYILTVLLIEGIYVLSFPDRTSVSIGMGIILASLIIWELYEYIKEVIIVKEKLCCEKEREERIRQGNVYVGRDGVEIPVEEQEYFEVHYIDGRVERIPRVTNTIDYTSYTSAPPLPTRPPPPPTPPRPRRFLDDSDFSTLLKSDKEVEHKTPTVRKIRGDKNAKT